MIKLLRFTYKKQIEEALGKMAIGDFSAPQLFLQQKRSPVAAVIDNTYRGLKGLIRIVENSSKLLHSRMADIASKSNQIEEQVDGVTSIIREMSEGMQDASESVQSIASEMAQIHNTVENIRISSGRVMGTSLAFTNEVTAGKDGMVSALGQMRRIAADGDEIRNGMEELDQALELISRITLVIEEISGQTRLLALNANIEAARAGEQGKGFAVVAGEITKLATETRQATVRIGEQIQMVTNNAGRLTGSIDKMKETVAAGELEMRSAVERYERMEHFLNDTVAEMNRLDKQIAGIAGNSYAIADSVNQTSAMIQQVAAGSEEVQASSEVQQQNIKEMNEFIRHASHDSLTLRSVISQFKLPPQHDQHPLSKETDALLQCALGIRAIMVSMVYSSDPAVIRQWNERKAKQEQHMHELFEQLSCKVGRPRDLQFFASVQSAWNEFGEIKDRNAAWMLQGEIEKAKQGLANVGRERFKRTLDLINEWMEQ